MAAGVSARLSPAESRKFGLVVGGGFLVLAAVAQLRHHPVAAVWRAGVGGLLAILGVARAAWLSPIHREWMALGHALSRVTTPILMSIIFFLVVTPIGLLLRLAGKNPIPSPGPRRGRWVSPNRPADPRAAMERQF
jgi:hypothetical protein